MNQAEIRRRQAQALSVILTLVTIAVIARVTGENGVAYIVAALELYGLVWTVVCGNTADALSKLLRIRNSKGQYRNALNMRRSVFVFEAILGAVGSLLLLLLASRLTNGLFRMQYSTMILLVLAPAVFLRTLSGVLTGFFQGEGSELPTAVSSILRQLFILGFGLLFGRMLASYGGKVSQLLLQENFASMYGGVGIAIGVTLTEAFIVVFLFLIYKVTKHPKKKLQEDGMRFTDSFVDCLRIFCTGRGIQQGIWLLVLLPFPLGLLFFQKAAGNVDVAATEYGAYIAGYGVVCGIVIMALYMMLLPTVTKIFVALRKEEARYARVILQGGMHICAVHGVFGAVFLMVLSSQMAATVSAGQPGIVAKMLSGGGALVLFVPLLMYFGRILLLSGRKLFVLGVVLIADIVYAVAATVFINVGKMGIYALVYGGVISAGILCVLLGFLVFSQYRHRFDWLQLVVPAGAACVTGLLMMFLAKLLTPHMGNLVTMIVLFVVGEAVYWVLLLVLRNFREQELEAIPGGKIINALGQMLHCIR